MPRKSKQLRIDEVLQRLQEMAEANEPVMITEDGNVVEFPSRATHDDDEIPEEDPLEADILDRLDDLAIMLHQRGEDEDDHPVVVYTNRILARMARHRWGSGAHEHLAQELIATLDTYLEVMRENESS
jgi:hypothetical protein